MRRTRHAEAEAEGKLKSNAGDTKYMLHFICIRNLPVKTLLAQFGSLFMKSRLMCTFAVMGNEGNGRNTFGKKKKSALCPGKGSD